MARGMSGGCVWGTGGRGGGHDGPGTIAARKWGLGVHCGEGLVLETFSTLRIRFDEEKQTKRERRGSIMGGCMTQHTPCTQHGRNGAWGVHAACSMHMAYPQACRCFPVMDR